MRTRLNRFISHLLVFSFIGSTPAPVLSATSHMSNSLTLEQQLDGFIKEYSDKEYAYELTAEELETAFQEADTEGSFSSMIFKINQIKNKWQVPNAKIQFDRHDEIEKMEQEALEIVKRLFKQQSILDMNLSLIGLFHDYIFQPEKRGPLSVIFKTIENYKFSEDDLRELQRKKTLLSRGTSGFNWATGVAAGVITVFALFRLKNAYLAKKALKKESLVLEKESLAMEKESITLEKIKPNQTITESAIKAPRYKEPVGPMSRNEYFKQVGGTIMGYTINDFENAKNITQVSVHFFKYQNYKKILSQGMSSGLSRLAKYAGIGALGAAGNIGLQAFLDVEFPPTANDNGLLHPANTYLNPDELKHNFYDGIAILNLSCRSRAMEIKSRSIKSSEERFEILKEMNEIYSEFELLKDIAPHMMEKVSLSKQVQYNPNTGKITFDIPHLNLNSKGEFDCQKKMGHRQSPTPLEASLPEVLYDVGLTYFNL